MKVRTLASAVALMACAVSTAGAAEVVYAGDLTPAAQTGSAGGYSWFFDDGAAVEFWRLFATAGSTVTLRVDRLDADFDPALSLYRGVTTADTSEFLSYADWGGLSYIDYLDDENPAAVSPGPAGDPFGSFVAPVTGYYTVAVGGSLSVDEGPYAYSISAVPEPHAALMLGLGLAAVSVLRRRTAA